MTQNTFGDVTSAAAKRLNAFLSLYTVSYTFLISEKNSKCVCFVDCSGYIFWFKASRLKNEKGGKDLLIEVKDKEGKKSEADENYEGRQYSFLVQIGKRRKLQYMKIFLYF